MFLKALEKQDKAAKAAKSKKKSGKAAPAAKARKPRPKAVKPIQELAAKTLKAPKTVRPKVVRKAIEAKPAKSSKESQAKEAQAPAGAITAPIEKAPAPKKSSLTAPVAICVTKEAAQACVGLFDAWRATSPVTIAPGVEKLRARLQKDGVTDFYVGASVPIKLWESLEKLAKRDSRKRNWLAAWCVAEGAKRLKLNELKTAYKDGTTPTLSLTVNRILQKGLEIWKAR